MPGRMKNGLGKKCESIGECVEGTICKRAFPLFVFFVFALHPVVKLLGYREEPSRSERRDEMRREEK
jgi:hypothetical protein